MFSLLLALAASPSAHADVLRHALIVGSNAPSEELVPLLYAEQDARRVADLLVELGGFERSQITVLQSPDRQGLDAAMAAHDRIARAHPEDLFLFYYSGHADHEGLRLGNEVMSFDALRQRVRAVPAEVRLGVLDACRSGEITRLKGLSLAEPFIDESALSAEGEAWLTAASADEAAQESDRIQGSFFTHYLMSGLRGAADTGDGVVSLDEAYAYAYDRTVARTGRTTGGTQHPSYDFRIQGKGDLPLTDVRNASAAIVLPLEMAGVISILRMPDELPVAEVAKSSGAETRLALPPGSYLLQVRSAGALQEARFGLGTGSELRVRATDFVAPDRQVASKGEAEEMPVAGPPPGWRMVEPPLASPVPVQNPQPAPVSGFIDRTSAQLGSAITSGVEEVHELFRKDAASTGSAEESNPATTGSSIEGAQTPPPEESLAPEAPPAEAAAAFDPSLPPALDVGAASVETLDVDSTARVQRVDLRHSPAIGGAASLLLPGAGQAYNGEWVQGAVFLGAWAATTGGAFGVSSAMGEDMKDWGGLMWTGPTPVLMAAQAVRGWAAADAWQYNKRELHRPVTGVTLGYGTLWATGDRAEQTATARVGGAWLDSTGLSIDWIINPGFSLGIDRTGYLKRPDGTVVVDTGARMMLGFFERSPVRPALFAFGDLAIDTSSVEESTASDLPLTSTAGGGANLRWYLTPRYFVELEGRIGTRKGELVNNVGAGLGIHLGRPGQGRPETREERREREELERVEAAKGGA